MYFVDTLYKRNKLSSSDFGHFKEIVEMSIHIDTCTRRAKWNPAKGVKNEKRNDEKELYKILHL